METIVVTASAGAFSGLAEALRDTAVTVERRPLVSFCPPADWSQLDGALAGRRRYGSLALTSPRAAMAVAERIRVGGLAWKDKDSPPVWAVGMATVAALPAEVRGTIRGPRTEADAEESAAGRLAHAMLAAGARGPVLFPSGEKRREELPRILRTHGVEVDEVVCYRTMLATQSQARAAVAGSTILVVASPSVVELVAASCPVVGRPALVAIGPTTAASARAAGWPPAAIASAPSTPALASAITGLLENR